MRKILIIGLVVFVQICAMAQETISFDLEKKGGHLFFKANVCGEQTDIMLESGIPALLISREFYERNIGQALTTIATSQERIQLLHKKYDIIQKANEDINIGGINYHGPIFILDNFEGMSIPVQYFTDNEKHAASVILDFNENKMTIISSKEALNYTGTKIKIHYDKNLGFPLISANIRLTTSAGRAKLKGDLLIDFGNPMVLFLTKQHKEITKAIDKGKIVPLDAYNQQGEIVAQGVYANELSLCGAVFTNISVGITPQPFKQLGLLGLSFFEHKKMLFNFDKAYFQIIDD